MLILGLRMVLVVALLDTVWTDLSRIAYSEGYKWMDFGLTCKTVGYKGTSVVSFRAQTHYLFG